LDTALQAVQGPGVRGQAKRRGRPLPRSAGARPRALGRREEPDAGAGSDAARPAAQSDRPQGGRWANAVEGFFAKLRRRRPQRGAFHSLVDLQATINRYLTEHNQKPRPFVWTADPDRIIEKADRRYQASASDHQQGKVAARTARAERLELATVKRPDGTQGLVVLPRRRIFAPARSVDRACPADG
jgi:hypothetical protein